MVCKGVVKGNTVILENGATLADGTQVEVRPLVDGAVAILSEAEKDAALSRLISMNLPVADWPQMEDEIIRGAIE